jgi:DNA-binding NarL/FixJ family response regulator
LVAEEEPDLVVTDMQTGKMGGMATCMELRLEESAGRIGHVPTLLLVDRRPDVFLARRAGADGFVVKPINPVRLRRAAEALLEGGTYEDPSYRPETVAAC